jgi:hypothetical protein
MGILRRENSEGSKLQDLPLRAPEYSDYGMRVVFALRRFGLVLKK